MLGYGGSQIVAHYREQSCLGRWYSLTSSIKFHALYRIQRLTTVKVKKVKISLLLAMEAHRVARG
jgi:hypothetical protein